MFILLYKFISCIYVFSSYIHNYHKLFCCRVVAFHAIVMPLVFLTYYGRFWFAGFIPLYYIQYKTISTSYFVVLALVGIF